MAHFDDAHALVEHARQELGEIRAAYDASLHDKVISPKLLIGIKNFMENLRSALDFTAHGLFAKFGSSPHKAPKVCFPYASQNQDIAAFRQSKRVEACIPGITAARPDVVAMIEGYQHFAGAANAWLPVFMDLSNANKHQQLTPQVRRETRELRISSGGASISLGEGASISMGPGTSIQMGRLVIPGGQEFDVTRPPRTIGEGRTEVITWVSFHFSSNGAPVLPLLESALDGVGRIVANLSRA
jgi:hypothetical protein